MNKTTDSFKRLQAVIKDVNGAWILWAMAFMCWGGCIISGLVKSVTSVFLRNQQG